jgi:hypothetical protein
MQYEKPDVVLLSAAVNAIQGTQKNSNVIPDSPSFLTTAAYEADE